MKQTNKTDPAVLAQEQGTEGSAVKKRKRPSAKTASVITALVLLAVLVLNAAVSFLTRDRLLITDLTEEGLYTVDPMYRAMLDETFETVNAQRASAGEDPVQVKILFCEDPDVLIASSSLRYVYYTALSLQKLYPQTISVTCVDIWKNPSAVQEYRVNAAANIYAGSVIVSSGTEYRIYRFDSFFNYDEDDYTYSNPNMYWGDKIFTKAIRSVTRAESPVCCLITNHGETYGENFIRLVRSAGYQVVENFNLRYDPIPDNCRLLVSSGPVTDYYAIFGEEADHPDGDDEIDKLISYLGDACTFLFFASPESPKLNNLEEYLEEWGVRVDRNQGEAFTVIDQEHTLNSDGSCFTAQTVTAGYGASFLSDMIAAGTDNRIVFRNSTSLSIPDSYRLVEQTGDASDDESFIYYEYAKNGIGRNSYDLFRAGASAVATAGDLISNTGDNRLMILSRERHIYTEDKGYTYVVKSSFVIACASAEFISDDILNASLYGNTDALLSVLRSVAEDTVPTDNNYRSIHTWKLGSILALSEEDAQGITVAFAIVPALILLIACVIVMIRRRRFER